MRSAETNTLSVWLAERQRKFTEKDCDSAKLMSIEEYERLGSRGWTKQALSSRSSYHCNLIDGDAISSIFIMESEVDLTSSPTSDHQTSIRSGYGHRKVTDEDRLSRIIHRASLRSYVAERSFSEQQL